MAPVKVRARNGASKTASRRVIVKPVEFKRPEKANSRIAKQIFRGKGMSLAGTFTDSDGKIISHEQIAGWITHHGGVMEREVNDSTTHLICSIDEFKKKTKQVQKAWSLGTNNCLIVVLDWIEDCLLGKHLKKRLLVEKGYTLDRTIARLKKGKTDHATFRAKFEDGIRASKELCDNKLHHVFYDQTGFEYKVVLTRLNPNINTILERYTIFLFESHAIPHIYMCGAKFTRSHRPTSYYRDDCHPKDFPSAYADFKHIFKVKAGTEWDLRLEKTNFGKEEKERYFVYWPPVLGRPVGLLPAGYKRPEEREDKERVKNSNEKLGVGMGKGEEVYGVGYGRFDAKDENVMVDGVEEEIQPKSQSPEGKGEEVESEESAEAEEAEGDVVYDTDSEVDSSDEETEDSEGDGQGRSREQAIVVESDGEEADEDGEDSAPGS